MTHHLPLNLTALVVLCLGLTPAACLAEDAKKSDAVRVIVWDEQQPTQKKAYDNFLGNAIADYLSAQPGLVVKSVHLDEPEYGLGGHALDQCDVLIWWGHVRNREVPFELGKKIVERVKAGKLALLCLHSAHWSAPFIEAMNARTIDDATKTVPSAIREQTKVTLIPPKVYRVPKKDAKPTPSWELKNAADGTHELVITLPSCVFPAYRADGQPSHVTTLLPDHPIAAHIPAHFDLPATEMYDAPFWVPAPDVVIFEERWDKGEHFPSGCLWNLGKGLVFYFRPGHEIYPVYKQKEPLQIIENATRWMAWEIRYTSDIAEPKR